MMTNRIWSVPDILLPNASVDLTKWSVVACDQYTSEPDYWSALDRFVGQSPSTLRIIYPETYLGQHDEARIRAINATMADYRSSVLTRREHGYVYLERTLSSGIVRRGLLLCIDLDAYDFRPERHALIRATEATIVERIPPRVSIRKDAPLELPHIMLLCDDKDQTVIEPLTAQASRFRPLYDTDLSAGGGHLRGWLIDADAERQIDSALDLLASHSDDPMLFAVGDGNHSLATAKRCRELIASTLSAEEAAVHPSRYALCELVNLHDSALVFEPIHRVLFHADKDKLLACLAQAPVTGDREIRLSLLCADGQITVSLFCNPLDDIGAAATAQLQKALDAYLAVDPAARIDYVHGDDSLRRLAVQPGNIGFLLPPMDKSRFFDAVRLHGCLARKTFSMGLADEKRYYMEARAIR